MAVAKIEYKKEFFDRDYTFREAYGRVWKCARKYRLRLAVGVICGMATAGTLVPFFQIVQPALQHVESHDAEIVREEAALAVEAVPEAYRGQRVKCFTYATGEGDTVCLYEWNGTILGAVKQE